VERWRAEVVYHRCTSEGTGGAGHSCICGCFAPPTLSSFSSAGIRLYRLTWKSTLLAANKCFMDMHAMSFELGSCVFILLCFFVLLSSVLLSQGS
jgi:hypothetical protein